MLLRALAAAQLAAVVLVGQTPPDELLSANHFKRFRAVAAAHSANDAEGLLSTVFTNTRFKQFFTITDRMLADDLMKASGSEIRFLTSITTRYSSTEMSFGSTEQPFLQTRMSQEDINAINDSPTNSLLWVTAGAGYTRFGGAPVWVQSPYPMPESEYLARKMMPWPRAEETLPSGAKTTIAKEAPEEIEQRAKADYAKLEQFFLDIVSRTGRRPLTR